MSDAVGVGSSCKSNKNRRCAQYENTYQEDQIHLCETTRRDHKIMVQALFLQKELDSSSQCLPFTNCWDLEKLFTPLSLSPCQYNEDNDVLMWLLW